MTKSGTINSFAKNFLKIGLWKGATGTIQQSLADTHGSMNEKQIQKDIMAHKSTATVDVGNHKAWYERIKDQLADVSSTFASSKEFVEMEKAFKALDSADPNYPQGREEEYKAKLEALQKASQKYIDAKQADGKTERSTGRGQKRFTLAKRMATFAGESLTNIKKAEEACMVANIPDKRPSELDARNFNKYMDEMLAPHAKGAQDLIDNNIFKTKSTETTSENLYVPDDIELPENCPFTDHEFAIMSYAEIANGKNFRGSYRSENYFSDEANALRAFTFSHDDIFMNFRPNTKNDVPFFNNARHSAENNLKEYMKGNPKPLAKSLKNNIDITLKHIRTMNKVDRQMQTHLLSVRQSLDMLRKDPALLKASGITGKEIKEIAAREAMMKLLDDKKLAQEALKNPDKLSPQEIDNCYAKIIALDVLAAAESREIDNSSSSKEASRIDKAFEEGGKKLRNLRYKIEDVEKGKIQLSDEEKKQLDNEYQIQSQENEVLCDKLTSMSAFREPSELLQRFADPNMFDINCEGLMTIVMKNSRFAKIKANPNLLLDSATIDGILASADKNLKSMVDKYEISVGDKAEAKLTKAPKAPVAKENTKIEKVFNPMI